MRKKLKYVFVGVALLITVSLFLVDYNNAVIYFTTKYSENFKINTAEKQTDQVLNNKMSEEELTELVNTGIYTKDEINQNLRSCLSESDVQFCKYLLVGNYEAAFAMNPKLLSDRCTIIMADHANRLYTRNKYEEFVKFNNAIMESSKMCTDDFLDNSKEMSYLTYRDIYLERMYIGTKSIQTVSLINVALMDPKTAEYSAMEDSYNDKWDMANLWASEYTYMINLPTTGSVENLIGTKMLGIIKDKDTDNLELIVEHYSYLDYGYVEDNILIESLSTPIGYGNADFIIEMNRLKNKIKHFRTRKVPVIPSTMFCLVKEVMLTDNVMGIEGCGQSNVSQLGSNSIQTSRIDLMNYLSDYYLAKGEMEADLFQEKMDWFGSCGEYSFLDSSGEIESMLINLDINNPDMLRAMYQYQTEGMGSITGWNYEEVNQVINDIKTADVADYFEETRVLSLKILEKKYNLFDDSYTNDMGEKIQVEFRDFREAIDFIDDYGDSYIRHTFCDKSFGG